MEWVNLERKRKIIIKSSKFNTKDINMCRLELIKKKEKKKREESKDKENGNCITIRNKRNGKKNNLRKQ